MPVCPKCGYRRKLWQMSQYCPHCKTNVVFFGFEERFYEDAKKAEMSLANVRMKVAKVKGGLIGSSLAIARFAVILPVLLSLLVPFGSATVTLPVYEKTISFGGIGLYQAWTDGTFRLLGAITGGEVLGETAAAALPVLFGLSALAGVAVLMLLCTLFSFAHFKAMAGVLCALSSLGLAADCFIAVCFSRVREIPVLLAVKNGPGAFVVAAALTACFLLNMIIAKKGLAVTYRPGDPERVAVRRRYLKKELPLEDIPFPIYQTEEERAAREKAIAETSEKLRQAREEEETDG